MEISSSEEALTLIHDVFDGWSKKGARFAWRGQVNASWALHSSLYRRVMWTNGAVPDEAELAKVEDEILTEVHRWGLHIGDHGRLSVLSQLAVLQHYGAPTRLIDVTFNPLIGLWFAVEAQWSNGAPKDDDKDGRLFAIDVSTRLINEDRNSRSWEDDNARPWAHSESGSDALDSRDWTTTVRVWRPARLDHRIAAQNGAFLVAGVPGSSGTGGPVQWPKMPGGDAWKIEEVREALSVPLRFHKLDKTQGREPNNPAYTIRIKASAKSAIRKHLQDLYGYRHSTLYPDYSGFALYGRPTLKSLP